MRSAGGRRLGSSRVYSRKPVTLPTEHLRGGGRLLLHSMDRRQKAIVCPTWGVQHALVFLREDLDELLEHGVPVFQYPLGARAARQIEVLLDQIENQRGVLQRHRVEIHTRAIAAAFGEVA